MMGLLKNKPRVRRPEQQLRLAEETIRRARRAMEDSDINGDVQHDLFEVEMMLSDLREDFDLGRYR
jgi:hypothetical protein